MSYSVATQWIYPNLLFLMIGDMFHINISNPVFTHRLDHNLRFDLLIFELVDQPINQSINQLQNVSVLIRLDLSIIHI
jgi:hypothetical protein